MHMVTVKMVQTSTEKITKGRSLLIHNHPKDNPISLEEITLFHFCLLFFCGSHHISAYSLTYILIIYQFLAAICENLALTTPNLSPTPNTVISLV